METPPNALPVYLVLDTNWLIYLAEGQHEQILEAIHKKLEDGAFLLVVCENVMKEWEHHDPSDNLIKKIKGDYVAAKNLTPFMDVTDRTIFNDLLSKYASTESDRIRIAQARVEKVSKMIKDFAVSAPVTNEVKDLVIKHGIEKKAPIHTKNGVSDAIIFFSAYELLKKESKGHYSNTFFISFNSKDFSDPADIDLIHPDLKPYLEEIGMKFERNIAKGFQLAQESEYAIEEFLSQSWDEYYEKLDEYLDQMRNEHYYSEFEISQGK